MGYGLRKSSWLIISVKNHKGLEKLNYIKSNATVWGFFTNERTIVSNVLVDRTCMLNHIEVTDVFDLSLSRVVFIVSDPSDFVMFFFEPPLSCSHAQFPSFPHSQHVDLEFSSSNLSGENSIFVLALSVPGGQSITIRVEEMLRAVDSSINTSQASHLNISLIYNRRHWQSRNFSQVWVHIMIGLIIDILSSWNGDRQNWIALTAFQVRVGQLHKSQQASRHLRNWVSLECEPNLLAYASNCISK